MYPEQYGFIRGRSTEQAMLDIVYKIIDAIENKKIALGVFLDLSKAFDSISHHILLKKLNYYGIRGLAGKWFNNYLSDRKQYIDLNGTVSSSHLVTSGVPQGSVLGPLLFLLYVNDMPSASSLLELILFADDTTALYNSASLDDVFHTMNMEINKLNTWFNVNKLSINLKKTNFILFMTRQKESFVSVNDDSHSVHFGSTRIDSVSYTKFLGLFLDKNLNLKEEINLVCSKLSKGIYALSRAAKILPLSCLKTLYSSLILPYLNYGLLIWGGICKSETDTQSLDRGEIKNHMKNLHPISILQKRALRIISNSHYLAHHIPICYELKILDLEHLYNIKALSLFYDYFHGKLPPFFVNKLSLHYNRHNELIIKTQFRRTDLASTLVFNTLPTIWNTLPSDLKSYLSKTKKTFLSKMKNYYISSYENWKCLNTNCYACKCQVESQN